MDKIAHRVFVGTYWRAISTVVWKYSKGTEGSVVNPVQKTRFSAICEEFGRRSGEIPKYSKRNINNYFRRGLINSEGRFFDENPA